MICYLITIALGTPNVEISTINHYHTCTWHYQEISHITLHHQPPKKARTKIRVQDLSHECNTNVTIPVKSYRHTSTTQDNDVPHAENQNPLQPPSKELA
jgi:hypothetical protein